jgi:hypothetical protein
MVVVLCLIDVPIKIDRHYDLRKEESFKDVIRNEIKYLEI